VSSLAENVRLVLKGAGHPPLGIEGNDGSDWVLVDLGDVIVHVMTEEMREFYALEKLWSVGPDSGSGPGTADTGKDGVIDTGAAQREQALHSA